MLRHVFKQQSTVGEPPLTEHALITFLRVLGQVCAHVLGKVRPLSEGSSTFLATVGSLTRVCPHVALQRELSSETPAADHATVGLLPCVRPHVRLQVALVSEGLVTDGAAERFLSCVDASVHLQPLPRGESLLTETALVFPSHSDGAQLWHRLVFGESGVVCIFYLDVVVSIGLCFHLCS